MRAFRRHWAGRAARIWDKGRRPLRQARPDRAMRSTRICCASHPRVTLVSIWVGTWPLPLSPEGFGAAGRTLMKDEGRAAGGLGDIFPDVP